MATVMIAPVKEGAVTKTYQVTIRLGSIRACNSTRMWMARIIWCALPGSKPNTVVDMPIVVEAVGDPVVESSERWRVLCVCE